MGAAKCGTTALYQYLQGHPGVFMTTPKEPNYFAEDLHKPFDITEESAYLKLFDKAPADSLRGEASVQYLNSNFAIERLLQHSPKTKILILLRNPVELVQSWHAQLLHNGEESITNLEAAWNAQQHRRGSGQADSTPRLQYRDWCAVGQHTARAAAIVPPEQLSILLLEDLRRDPGAFFRSVTDFLELDYIAPVSEERVNASTLPRSGLLARLIHRASVIENPQFRRLSSPFRKLGIRPLRVLRKINTQSNEHLSLDEKFKQELQDIFDADISLLEALLGRSLTHWKSS